MVLQFHPTSERRLILPRLQPGVQQSLLYLLGFSLDLRPQHEGGEIQIPKLKLGTNFQGANPTLKRGENEKLISSADAIGNRQSTIGNDSTVLIQDTTDRSSSPLSQPAAPPEQDADPLLPTHTGSAIEFVLVLSRWL